MSTCFQKHVGVNCHAKVRKSRCPFEEREISVTTLYFWKKRLKERAVDGRPEPVRASADSGGIVELPGEYRIGLPKGLQVTVTGRWRIVAVGGAGSGAAGDAVRPSNELRQCIRAGRRWTFARK